MLRIQTESTVFQHGVPSISGTNPGRHLENYIFNYNNYIFLESVKKSKILIGKF